jgi:hypothetical protein
MAMIIAVKQELHIMSSLISTCLQHLEIEIS